MEQLDFAYGSFNINFKDGKNLWYLAIHPEMIPAKMGIRPSGRYHIFCIHPERGSCSFIIEQDDSCMWLCERKPGFFSAGFVQWIGSQIEIYSR